MPNENDNKLVTLADLSEAYIALYNRDVMTSTDKDKLDNIEAGAQVNTVTGVKGDKENDFRIGNVILTPANIGAMPEEPPKIELKPPVGSGLGGAIDFHFNGSTADYTTRIMETASGQLSLYGSLTISSPLDITYGGTKATTPAGARENLHAMQNPDTSIVFNSSGNLDNAPAGFSTWDTSCFNNPFGFHVSVLTIAAFSNWYQQIAFPWSKDETRIAYRVCSGGTSGGTWHPWRYITMS